MLKLLSYRLLL